MMLCMKWYCDPILKDQVCNHEDYEAIDSKQDTIGTLRVIKKFMYSNGDDDRHMGYNHIKIDLGYEEGWHKEKDPFPKIIAEACNILFK